MKSNESHYVEGKKNYVRVTGVLKTAWPLPENPVVLKNIYAAGERGTKVHAAMNAALLFKKSGKSILPILAGLKGNEEEWARKAERGVEWIEENIGRKDVIEVEKIYCSDVWGYGGKIDAILRIKGKVFLVDWKTSGDIEPSHRLQLAAYQILIAEKKIKAFRMIVHLKENAAKAIPLVNDATHKAAWLSLLQFHKLKDAI